MCISICNAIDSIINTTDKVQDFFLAIFAEILQILRTRQYDSLNTFRLNINYLATVWQSLKACLFCLRVWHWFFKTTNFWKIIYFCLQLEKIWRRSYCFHVCTLHQWQNFIIQQMHKYVIRRYNTNYKIFKSAPTYFGSQRIHHQGALYSTWLKLQEWFYCVRWLGQSRCYGCIFCPWCLCVVHCIGRHWVPSWWWILFDPKHVGALLNIL